MARQIATIDARSNVFRNYAWEWMLGIILLLVFVICSTLSPNFLSLNKLVGATPRFIDKAFIALPMAMVIAIGMIDISVASTVALSSVLMAMSYNAGLPMGLAIVLCILVGLVCGLINGVIIANFPELAPMIVTLATQIIYRGIAYILLEDQSSGSFPAWFMNIAAGSVGPIPYMLICFLLLFVAFAFVMHKTSFGRRLYAIGKNPLASRFSGVDVKKHIIIAYTLTGLMAAVTALFLTSRMSSTRPNVALGYELEVITIVVLGGFSTSGGKGRMGGLLISVFIIGYLRHGLGLININAQILMIIIGALLVLAVMIPEIAKKISARRRTFKTS